MTLQDTHNDLLSLLAQEELELSCFRRALEKHAGQEAVSSTFVEAEALSVEKYGSYVNLRDDREVADLSTSRIMDTSQQAERHTQSFDNTNSSSPMATFSSL